MKWFLTSVFSVGITALALAESAPSVTPPQLPPGPLLNPIPDFTQWTITQKLVTGGGVPPETQKAGPQAGKQQASQTAVGQKTGDIEHVLTTYSNGLKMDFWKKGEMQSTQASNWKIPIVSPAAKDDFFSDLAWVSGQNFDGIRKVGGVDCLIFHAHTLPPGVSIPAPTAPLIGMAAGFKPPPDTRPDPESLKVDAIAYIEADRRLPMAVKLGAAVITYKFESIKPQVMLNLPPAVAAAMTAHDQQARAMLPKEVRP